MEFCVSFHKHFHYGFLFFPLAMTISNFKGHFTRDNSENLERGLVFLLLIVYDN